MGNVALTEINKIPYLNVPALGDRTILLMPLWDGSSWRQWADAGEAGLVQIQIVDAVRTNYIANAPAKETDLWIPFVDFMWQRASWPEVSRLTMSICEDFHLLGTSAAKLRHFFETRAAVDHSLLASFVESELEYLLTVCRSVFDLFQEAIAVAWNGRLLLLDPELEARRRRHKLPKTFSGMVLLGDNSIRSADEMVEKYALPPSVAEAYAAYAPFFGFLRTWRDRIVHGGSSLSWIYVTERGFCIDPKGKAFCDFTWTEAHRYNENIVSLLPWVAYVVAGTIEACTRLLDAFATVLQFPPEIAPGYGIFVRDPANEALLELQCIATGGPVWWGEPHTPVEPG